MDENLEPRHQSDRDAVGPHAIDDTPLEDSDAASSREAESLLDAYLADRFALPADVIGLKPDDDADDRASAGSGVARAGSPSGPGLDGLIPVQPMNLRALTSAEAELYWRALDDWVDWLRRDYGLGVAQVPPLWHRHAELRWELSALHTAWLASYDSEASALAPVAWHRELAESLRRLHDWIGQSGTTLAEDRPTQVTLWPGEPGYGTTGSWQDAAVTIPVVDRVVDFEAWLAGDLAARRAVEDQVRATLPTLAGRLAPRRRS
ncbi:hypothetical protein [Myceligenerans crystallogenes]|uniref:DUF4913 domain-containing protein n=1 Tax=Myceligenerans crystallogenes TaxID=316335 RepID=A0ABN2NAE6_9MICO